MPEDIKFCPNGTYECKLEPRYDIEAPSDEAVESISEAVEDEYVAKVLESASTKRYRGDICLKCGAFFSAEPSVVWNKST